MTKKVLACLFGCIHPRSIVAAHFFCFRLRKTFTAERVEQLRQLAREPDIYERLAKALGIVFWGGGMTKYQLNGVVVLGCTECDYFLSLDVCVLAPSIYENDDIKKGILLQLFGGTKKDFRNTGRGRFRCSNFRESVQ